VTRPKRVPTGLWYYVIAIVSMGMLAFVPFLHAASKLKRRDLWKLGAVYGGIAFVAVLLVDTAPTNAAGSATGVAANIGGFALLGLVVAACVQLRNVRRDVYGTPGRLGLPRTGNPSQIAAINAARGRRRQARQLAARDPLMARELRIGRPDLYHEYDDGGMVDLNSAPAPVIAQVCGIPPAIAEAITQAREKLGQFSSVDEALVYAEVTDSRGIIKDRAITL
jgi:hypothetical protein